MKYKIFIIFIMLFIISACSNSGDDESEIFTLPIETEQKYDDMIDETLYNFYWKYDESSMSYLKMIAPLKEDENKNAEFKASRDSGFDLYSVSGKECIVGTVNIAHFNDDEAGIAYFYFFNDKIVGAYYVNKNTDKIYGLNNRNVFTKNVEFKKYEDSDKQVDFKEYNTDIPKSFLTTIGKNKNGNVTLAFIDGNTIKIYYYDRFFRNVRTLSFNEGLIPVSATFFQGRQEGDRLAVILGRETYESNGIEETKSYTESVKVVFFDEVYNKLPQEIDLSSYNYTCASRDDKYLVLSRFGAIEYYENSDEGIINITNYSIPHAVTGFKSCDIDNDGIMEYIMTDGLDLYVYQKNGLFFSNIWRTHISMNNLENNIYTGDLNNDGIKEIYICDKTGTIIRYVLKEIGFISQNEDIEYGDVIYPGDFNNDGFDDYIKVYNAERTYQNLYISQGTVKENNKDDE